MTSEQLKTKLIEIRDRDGSYLDKRDDALEVLLDYALDDLGDSERKKLKELYYDTVE